MGELSKCNLLVVSKKPTGRHADANNDNYSTPEWAWRELFQAVPLLKKRRLWDPFYNDGLTAKCWKQLGIRDFVHSRGDFFKRATIPRHDVVVTNPPFSKKQLVVLSLLRRGKPFILLLRTSVLFTKWFRRLLPTVKLVFPSRQVNFDAANGKKLTFDCASSATAAATELLCTCVLSKIEETQVGRIKTNLLSKFTCQLYLFKERHQWE